MTHDDDLLVMFDEEYSWYFFSCALCPLSLPFLKQNMAEAYKLGHVLNSYHKRRLELLR